MQRSKSYRRRQEARARRRAIRFLKDICCETNISERNIHLYARNRKPCSCYICSGNKAEEHRWERRTTKQELRKDIQEDITCPKKKYSW